MGEGLGKLHCDTAMSSFRRSSLQHEHSVQTMTLWTRSVFSTNVSTVGAVLFEAEIPKSAIRAPEASLSSRA